MEQFVEWFRSQNGTVDTDVIALAEIPGQGRGAIAVRDISEGHTLFTIPRSLTLSLRTSSLLDLVGNSAWRQFQLHRGWVGLILCMMWEESRGAESKWSKYLESMPTAFSTPMFWSAEELEELSGTSIAEKIGREEAEKDYREKIVPAIKSRPDIFSPSHLASHYSLENYHIMGSRILSRSFHVEQWEGEGNEGQRQNDSNGQDGMDVDSSVAEVNEGSDAPEDIEAEEGSEDEDEDEDTEDPADVAMVPMADMLNARYASENAKLFYEPTELKMVTTKPIKAGDQIYNTYGDPPNADLLRRYGHVDVLPLGDSEDAIEGNPADEVEISADLSLQAVADHLKKDVSDQVLRERIDWWLEEGGDDIFVLKTDLVPPDGLVSFTKLLLLPAVEWEKARAKSKPPKAKLDEDILPLLSTVTKRRLEKYLTTFEDDVKLLRDSANFSLNKRNAIIVRLGEKRILKRFLSKLEKLREQLGSNNAKNSDKDKRKRDSESRSENGKRRKK